MNASLVTNLLLVLTCIPLSTFAQTSQPATSGQGADIRQKLAFLVTAKNCSEPDGSFRATRGGTAFLVRDWPDKGRPALVTALHVVHHCDGIQLASLVCSLEPSQRIGPVVANLPAYEGQTCQSSAMNVLVWPDRDLIVYRDVRNLLHRLGLTLSDLPARDEGTRLPESPDVLTLLGRTGSACPVHHARANTTSSLEAYAGNSWKTGTLDRSLVVLLYDPEGLAGTSGAAVLNKEGRVVAVHLAGSNSNPTGEQLALPLGNDWTKWPKPVSLDVSCSSRTFTENDHWSKFEFAPADYAQKYDEERARTLDELQPPPPQGDQLARIKGNTLGTIAVTFPSWGGRLEAYRWRREWTQAAFAYVALQAYQLHGPFSSVEGYGLGAGLFGVGLKWQFLRGKSCEVGFISFPLSFHYWSVQRRRGLGMVNTAAYVRWNENGYHYEGGLTAPLLWTTWLANTNQHTFDNFQRPWPPPISLYFGAGF